MPNYHLPPFRFLDLPTALTWPGRTQCQILLMFGVSLYFHLEIFLRLFLLSFFSLFLKRIIIHISSFEVWCNLIFNSARILVINERGLSNWSLVFERLCCYIYYISTAVPIYCAVHVMVSPVPNYDFLRFFSQKIRMMLSKKIRTEI